jgi:putative Mg2+ transporter-C (MgtC) family protein
MPDEVVMVLRLLTAAVLGGVLGYQRERSGKPAGTRTHMLICMGAAMFTLVSIYGFAGTADPSRLAAGVVTGIGFIGAGAILFRSGGNYISGLTTAATIWAVAGIGVAVGSGLYLLAVAAVVLALIVLLIPHFK